ncbi:PIG-L deacetylase family protein [Nonomuraea gerenzanensis]|uniref:Dbv21 protein n=1 Tax=Nonomuraea gerenzanensis TaxID=93944 RepID=Q7WZ70_9ACTN|nr:PIG-L family deacetylase [Nonomuraea gerenzanensis]UBU14932.1 PIG-L family deacetylase [Nonomuraea gerenzanensis]3DFI_A Chain A, Pseudoaglycone deacetylase Dbv21 [Actinoplanes teichomyceticus]CAD91216.1 Dbv21 protein [Nonomuraea gerenzanensis]
MLQDADRTRILAISPHLDDAVLSVGASLAQAEQDGGKVTVFTVFAGSAAPPYSPAAERFHARWGLSPTEDAPLRRRNEDIAALDQLGAGHRHGRFLDAIYRRSPDGQWLLHHNEGSMVRQQSPANNHDLVAAIREDIESMIAECDPTLVLTCVAIGKHPDHKATRDATLLAARERGIPLRLWQDLPYAAYSQDLAELPDGLRLGSPELSFVDEEARTRKFQAMKHYATQLSVLDGPNKNLFAKLDEHARNAAPDGGYNETTWPVIRYAAE